MRNHPLVTAAASGELPAWAQAGKARRAHMKRVASLLKAWAVARGERGREVDRWVAVGYLHDALREADPTTLRKRVPKSFRHLDGNVLHGPGAAARLRDEGVKDKELLKAVAYHTLGHPDFGPLGRALYAADFLEPGRRFRAKWRAKLRERMPENMDGVVREILAARIRRLVDGGRPIRKETMDFWNTVATGEAWVGASEP